MIYLFYFASFLFAPIQQMFDMSTTLLITFVFLIVIYGYILYCKTGNSVNDAIKASMLATLAFQLCNMFSHIDIITHVNHPVFAFSLICFLGILFAFKQSTNLSTAPASAASLTGLIGIIVSLPGNTLDAVLTFS